VEDIAAMVLEAQESPEEWSHPLDRDVFYLPVRNSKSVTIEGGRIIWQVRSQYHRLESLFFADHYLYIRYIYILARFGLPAPDNSP